MLIEFCASGDSKACDKRYWKTGSAFLRLTEKLDMRLRKNLDYAIQEVRKHSRDYHIVLHGSLPCTWGSPWQEVNMRKNPASQEIKMS